jgi:hypothetical protein
MTMPRVVRALLAMSLASAGACSSADSDERPRAVVGGTLSDEQRYEVAAADAWKAAESALEGDEFKVERRHRDDCGGKLVARREDGHRVTVTIHAPDRARPEISVYVEPGDPKLAQELQIRIGEKLSLKKAQAALLGETVLEASYEVDLETGLAAVERCCRALGLEQTLVQRLEGRARVLARSRERGAVRFVLRAGEEAAETQVVLSCDAAAEGGEKEFLRGIRRELERQLYPPAD